MNSVKKIVSPLVISFILNRSAENMLLELMSSRLRNSSFEKRCQATYETNEQVKSAFLLAIKRLGMGP